MGVDRSLQILITKNPKKARTFLTAASTNSSATAYIVPPLSSPLFHSRVLPFTPSLSKWIAPFNGGPLFLSSPPWKLSQSATPLWGNSNVLRKVQALNLDLITGGGAKFPIKLRFVSVLSDPRVLDRVETEKESTKEAVFESFVNLPNLISMSRLVSGPLLGWMIVNEMSGTAFVGLAISGATDWLDGYIARKMRINSVVGSYLDPLADKVLIGCVALSMLHNHLLHPGLVGLVVFRDVALVSGAMYQRASSLGWQWKSWLDFFNLDGTSPQKVEPLFISKVNTVFQLILVASALLRLEFGTPETQSCITYLSWLVAATTVGSTIAYGAQHMRKRPGLITRKP